MNKFVLSIFIVLAICMAELPSTFGCHPDYINGLPTTTTSTTSQRPPKSTPKTPIVTTTGPPKRGKGNPKGSRPEPEGYRGGRNVHAGGNVFELEMEGFSICNTDGTEGLTFDEINAGRVNILHNTYIHSY